VTKQDERAIVILNEQVLKARDSGDHRLANSLNRKLMDLISQAVEK
jgi:hypothetical protein